MSSIEKKQMFIFYTNFCFKKHKSNNFSEKFQNSETEMCLAMCLKKNKNFKLIVFINLVFIKKRV